MPVNVETTYVVNCDDEVSWKVPLSIVKSVGGKTFLKLKPRECSLIRMVCHGCVDLPKRQRFSLASTSGWNKLKQLRNDNAFCGTEPSAEQSFFGVTTPMPETKGAKKLRTPRRKALQLQELRKSPDIMEVFVPNDGVDGNDGLEVLMLKPAHPTDDIWIHLDGDTIQHILEVLRFELSAEALTTARSYGQHPDGGWSNGSAGVVKKVEADSDNETPPKRFRVIQSLAASKIAPMPLQLEAAGAEHVAPSCELECVAELDDPGRVGAESVVVLAEPWHEEQQSQD